MPQEVFSRFELKYLINPEVYGKLLERLTPYFFIDTYGDKEGFYNISNLYYDTPDNLFYTQSINRDPYRQKLRLRVYSSVTLDDTVFIEVKKKIKGVVNKRRTMIKLEDAYRFLELGSMAFCSHLFNASNKQILNEINFMCNLYKLMPKIVMSYDRQAFRGKDDSNLRITFDKNIRSRCFDLRIENGSYGEVFVPEDVLVMEVKISESVPLWLSGILSELQCCRRTFSKYSTCCSSISR